MSEILKNRKKELLVLDSSHDKIDKIHIDLKELMVQTHNKELWESFKVVDTQLQKTLEEIESIALSKRKSINEIEMEGIY